MSIPSVESLVSQAEAARDAGRLGEAQQWAEEAWAAVDPAQATQRRQVGVLLLQLRYRLGQLQATVDLALDVLPLLRASGPTTELIDALRLSTLCAAETNRFTLALGFAQEAHRLSLEIDDPARVSLSTNVLACFFERCGDPWQAERLMLESLSLARQLDDPYPRRVALSNLGAALIGKFYLLRDAVPLAQAQEPLRMAQPFAEESLQLALAGSDHFPQVFAMGNLGEIQVHLGQADEAQTLLDRALAMAHAAGFAAQVARIGVSCGELQLLRQQPALAWQTLQGVLQQASPSEQPPTRMRLHHALWRTAEALGRPMEALHHLQSYLTLERQRAVTQLQAQSELFVTRMEAEQMRLEAQRHRARASALEADVRRDQLTGLGNRRELEARWPEIIGQTRAVGAPLSVAMLDLDHFKRVNDVHGHAVGDAVLVALSGLLRTHTRTSDLVVRLGGEEFLLVLPDTGAERAAEVCERLRQRVADHDWAALAQGLAVTLSIGLTSAPPADAQTLSLRADAALYRAKAAGRNRLVQI